MSKESKDITENLIELRDMVNQGSEHTKRQIDSIQKHIYIGGILSLFIVLGATYWLEIFIYWIPASYILMYSWAIFSSISLRKPLKKEQMDKSIDIYKKTERSIFEHGAIVTLKNVSSFLKSITILYLVTFFIILALFNGWINSEVEFPIIIPIITCLIFFPAPFLLDNFINMFKERDYQKFVDKYLHLRKLSKKEKIPAIIIGKLLLAIFYILAILLLPLISIIQTWSLIDSWLILILVVD